MIAVVWYEIHVQLGVHSYAMKRNASRDSLILIRQVLNGSSLRPDARRYRLVQAHRLCWITHVDADWPNSVQQLGMAFLQLSRTVRLLQNRRLYVYKWSRYTRKSGSWGRGSPENANWGV